MILGLTAEEPEVEQKRTKRTKDFLESTSRFVSGRHLCCPCHVPTKGPPGFGLRQSSGAFRSGLGAQKRQRTAAVQYVIAAAHPPPRSLVPKRDFEIVEVFHERPFVLDRMSWLRGRGRGRRARGARGRTRSSSECMRINKTGLSHRTHYP